MGTTLLTNKSDTFVDIVYLKYFTDLDVVNEYAWGTVGLAYLYNQLSKAVLYKTK